MLADAEPWAFNADLSSSTPGRFGDVRYLPETGSTNGDLLAAARDGVLGPVVLVAGHQRAGRGRHDRVWFDQPGDSLLVSVLLTTDSLRWGLVPLVAGLAAERAVNRFSRQVEVRPDFGGVGLKWPNDLLVPPLQEKKLAGILVESVATKGGMAVVIGMGLNLQWSSSPPPEVEARATTLEATIRAGGGRWPADHARHRLLALYLTELDGALSVLSAGGGEAITVDGYRRRCLTIGREVRLTTPAGEVAGQAVDVDPDGQLLVETADGTQSVMAGDVRHLS